MSSFWIIQDCVVDSFWVRACVQRSKNLIVLFIGTFFSSAGFLVWARVRSNIQYVFIYIFKKKRKEKLCILFLFSAVDKWIDSEIQITTKQRTRNCVSCVQTFINKCVACIDIFVICPATDWFTNVIKLCFTSGINFWWILLLLILKKRHLFWFACNKIGELFFLF